MCGPCGLSEMCKDCTQNPNAEEYRMTECKFCKIFDFIKEIQKPKKEDGRKIRYKYTVAIVDQCYVNGDKRGECVNYTWLKFKYCPLCGKELKK